MDGILIVNPGRRVHGVDPKTGEYLWVNSNGGGPTDMVVNDKYVYFTSDNQWMYAIDGTTGEACLEQKSDGV
ncbi:MAG: PQQ-binding-like beta-propeller repeat protein [Saprospiraceae bacterium]